MGSKVSGTRRKRHQQMLTGQVGAGLCVWHWDVENVQVPVHRLREKTVAGSARPRLC